MKVEKSARRIEITLRYGDPLQPKIKARGYKWEPTKKVWWKGYTDEEMTWAQAQAEGKHEAAARFAERRVGATKLDATYKQTEPVKDDLVALGCFLDSTGERVYSRQKGEYVFAKSWYAPKDKADRAKAIIQYGGAAKADAAAATAAEAKAKHEAEAEELRAFARAHGVINADTISYGTWSANFRFAEAHERGEIVGTSGWTGERVIVKDAKTGILTICGTQGTAESPVPLWSGRQAAAAHIASILTAEQLPAAQAEAAQYGRIATGIRRSLQWRGSVAAKVGDVIHTKTVGWALVVGINAERISARDIEEREDRDDFSGRQTPGIETSATVIPVEPTAAEQAEQAEKVAAAEIRKQAQYVRGRSRRPPWLRQSSLSRGTRK